MVPKKTAAWTALASLALLGTGGSADGKRPNPAPPSTVRVTITRITAIDDLEGFGAGDPDFKAFITIGTKRFSSPTKTGKTIRPNWSYTSDVAGFNIPVTIRLMETDFPSADEHCDISPKKGEKDIILSLTSESPVFSGSVNGQVNVPVTVRGVGDSDRCEIQFTIIKTGGR